MIVRNGACKPALGCRFMSTRSSSVYAAPRGSIVLVAWAPKTGWAVAPGLFASLHLRLLPLALFFLPHGRADETNLLSWQRRLWRVREVFHRPLLSRKPKQSGSAVLP